MLEASRQKLKPEEATDCKESEVKEEADSKGSTTPSPAKRLANEEHGW